VKFSTLPLNSLALIVEDDEKLAEILAEAVKSAGYSVRSVQDGREAIRELDTLRPVLVILDLQLPGKPGAEILAYIRSSAHLSNTWVIVSSSETNQATALYEQADLVLIKPVSFIQIRDLARRLRRRPTP
jgi:DNA-binding response OmpR family regulator